MRFWLSGAIARRCGESFPLGTLVVNVSGAILIGIAAALLPSNESGLEPWRLGLITGVLGGYTTVSSFALQTLNLARLGELSAALLNVFASVLLCIGGAGASYATTQLLS
jgi:CrcB protein